MNKHTNKNKIPKDLAAHLAPVEHDRMPREAAVQLLVSGGLSSRGRKNCFSALERRYVSTFQPKSFQDKTMHELARVPIDQLDRWRHRVAARNLGLLKKWRALDVNSPFRQTLEGVARRLGDFSACLQVEIKNRLSHGVVG